MRKYAQARSHMRKGTESQAPAHRLGRAIVRRHRWGQRTLTGRKSAAAGSNSCGCEGDLGKTPTAGRDPEHGLGSGSVGGNHRHATARDLVGGGEVDDGVERLQLRKLYRDQLPLRQQRLHLPPSHTTGYSFAQFFFSLLTQLRHCLPPVYCKHFAAAVPPAAAGTVKFGADRAAQGGPMGP